MSSAVFSGILVVVFGLLACTTLVMGAVRRGDLPRSTRFLWLLTAAVALYCAILWGGHLAGWWMIAPQWGRFAMASTLAALTWGGLFHSNPNGKGNGREY